MSAKKSQIRTPHLPTSNRSRPSSAVKTSTKSVVGKLDPRGLTDSLRKENEELRAELAFIKSLYKQLMEEISIEKFDERRVNLLKSQIIQLERQVLLQSNALSERTAVLLEIENKLQNVRDTIRSLSPQGDLSDQVVISCDQLNKLVSIVEGGRQHLYKTVEDSSEQALSLPAIYMGTFLKQPRSSDEKRTVTLMDLCSGNTEHLNLKHVSRLESKLCKLYKEIRCLQKILCHQASTRREEPAVMSEHLAWPIRDRAGTQVASVSRMLGDCCGELLSLSILIPAAPWPALKKPFTSEITVDSVMQHMPDLSRRKTQEVRSVVETLNKAVSYSRHLLSLEVKILTEELKFHQQVYEQQVDYCETLFSAVSKAFTEFEGTSREMLCSPLQDVLDAYASLKDCASEESLRIFLVKFKERSQELTRIVESLQSHGQNGTGSSSISQFGNHFVNSLDSLTRDCVSKRDTLMKELLETKSQMVDDSKLGFSMDRACSASDSLVSEATSPKLSTTLHNQNT